MRHGEANDIIEQLWGNEMGWEHPTAEYYSNWLNPNGNRWYRSQTGAYDWNGRNASDQLLEDIDANPESADAYGYYTPQYVVTDSTGNVNISSPIILNKSELRSTGNDASPFSSRKLYYSDNGNSEFDGRYLIGDGIDEEGNVTGSVFWISPDPNKPWIFESGKIGQYVSNLPSNSIRLTPEISKILASNKEFLRKFQEDANFRDKFERILASSVGRAGNFAYWTTTRFSKNDWINMGFSPEEAQKLVNLFMDFNNANKFIETGKWKRVREKMVNKPTLHKDGGIVKASIGDTIGKSAGTQATATQIKTEKPIQDTREFTNWGKGKLQPHDYMELAAIVGDAASIGIGWFYSWIPSRCYQRRLPMKWLSSIWFKLRSWFFRAIARVRVSKCFY